MKKGNLIAQGASGKAFEDEGYFKPYHVPSPKEIESALMAAKITLYKTPNGMVCVETVLNNNVVVDMYKDGTLVKSFTTPTEKQLESMRKLPVIS